MADVWDDGEEREESSDPTKHHKYQYVVICDDCGIQPLTLIASTSYK